MGLGSAAAPESSSMQQQQQTQPPPPPPPPALHHAVRQPVRRQHSNPLPISSGLPPRSPHSTPKTPATRPQQTKNPPKQQAIIVGRKQWPGTPPPPAVIVSPGRSPPGSSGSSSASVSPNALPPPPPPSSRVMYSPSGAPPPPPSTISPLTSPTSSGEQQPLSSSRSVTSLLCAESDEIIRRLKQGGQKKQSRSTRPYFAPQQHRATNVTVVGKGVVTVTYHYTYRGEDHCVKFEYELKEPPLQVALEFARELGYPRSEMGPLADLLKTIRENFGITSRFNITITGKPRRRRKEGGVDLTALSSKEQEGVPAPLDESSDDLAVLSSGDEGDAPSPAELLERSERVCQERFEVLKKARADRTSAQELSLATFETKKADLERRGAQLAANRDKREQAHAKESKAHEAALLGLEEQLAAEGVAHAARLAACEREYAAVASDRGVERGEKRRRKVERRRLRELEAQAALEVQSQRRRDQHAHEQTLLNHYANSIALGVADNTHKQQGGPGGQRAVS